MFPSQHSGFRGTTLEERGVYARLRRFHVSQAGKTLKRPEGTGKDPQIQGRGVIFTHHARSFTGTPGWSPNQEPVRVGQCVPPASSLPKMAGETPALPWGLMNSNQSPQK